MLAKHKAQQEALEAAERKAAEEAEAREIALERFKLAEIERINREKELEEEEEA